MKIAASHVSDRSRVDVKAELVVTAAVLHKPTVVPRPLYARILVRHSSARLITWESVSPQAAAIVRAWVHRPSSTSTVYADAGNPSTMCRRVLWRR